jgi:plasmid maintenance system antidote protein VapI
MASDATQPSAADLRSDLARFDRRIYDIAPVVKMHPARLGQVLRGKLPLSPELAARIYAAIHQGEAVDSR